MLAQFPQFACHFSPPHHWPHVYHSHLCRYLVGPMWSPSPSPSFLQHWAGLCSAVQSVTCWWLVCRHFTSVAGLFICRETFTCPDDNWRLMLSVVPLPLYVHVYVYCLPRRTYWLAIIGCMRRIFNAWQFLFVCKWVYVWFLKLKCHLSLIYSTGEYAMDFIKNIDLPDKLFL